VLTAIVSEGSRLGVLWMASEHREIGEDGGVFAKVAALQMGAALALSRAFTRVNAAEAKYRAIFEHASEGIFRTDREGRVVTANPACAGLLGWESADVLTQQAPDLGSLFADPLQAAEFMRRLYDRGSVTAFEARLHGRSGHARWAIVSARALLDGEGDTTGYEGVLVDLSERKRADELRELEAARRQELELKSRFVSQMSHEIRSPLAVIHQFVSILADGLAGDLTPDQRQCLDIVGRNVSQLRGLVDNLLESARLESSRLTVTPGSMDLGAQILQAVEACRPAARAERILLTVSLDPALPAVHADPQRVTQVVANLLDNALKFTPAGGTVTVHVAASETGSVQVDVADNGTGIPLDEQEHIFEHLYQGTGAAQLSRRGLGIGLALCRELIVRQGGRLWVQSEPGSGSTFSFTLPIAGAVASRAATGDRR
jgi:PAS domain S-box-containing protein